MHKRVIRVAVGLAVLLAALMPGTAAMAAFPDLYKSTVNNTNAGNLPSVGPEAYAFKELGQQITLSHVGKVGKVVVSLSSWACQSGTWHTGDCSSNPTARATVPITLNIYNAATGADPNVPGSLIATITKPFAIPYRPSANYTHCTAGDAGKWWGGNPKKCLNGKLFNVAFDFGVQLPAGVVFGISYNTSHYGYAPIGTGAACYTTAQGCFYDSLNIALSQAPIDVTAGSNLGPSGTVFQNSDIGAEYCDGGADGTGIFRMDSDDGNVANADVGAGGGCWSVGSPDTIPYYTPAVQLQARS